MTPLTPKEISTLRWAVRSADTWRGSIVGDPDPTNLNQHDALIKECERLVNRLASESRRQRQIRARRSGDAR